MLDVETYSTLFTEKFIVHTAAGALVAIVISNLPKAGKFIKVRFASCPMEGNWWHYFYNFDECDNNACLKTEQVKIKRGVLSSYKIKTIPKNSSESPFYGTIEIEKGYLVVQLKAKEHLETVFQRYMQPNQWSKPILGVSIAHDYHGRNTSGVNILSRKELTPNEIEKLVKNRYMFDESTLTTRVLV